MLSCRCKTSNREIDRWIVSLKEKVEKSCKKENDHPEYSRCSAFSDDLLLIGFEHDYSVINYLAIDIAL